MSDFMYEEVKRLREERDRYRKAMEEGVVYPCGCKTCDKHLQQKTGDTAVFKISESGGEGER